MELCGGGEVFDRIAKRGHYSEKKAAELTRTIIGVVESCHSLGFIHRDLKPENFLFVNGAEDSPMKIIDFRLSVFFKPGRASCDSSSIYPSLHSPRTYWTNAMGIFCVLGGHLRTSTTSNDAEYQDD